MKKFLKFGAALTALVLGLACFVACSNDGGGPQFFTRRSQVLTPDTKCMILIFILNIIQKVI